MAETKNFKHFWIKVAPPVEERGTVIRSTLICEDNESAIIDAVNKFSSESPRRFGKNWLVEILRPDLSPVFRQAPLADFARLASHHRRIERSGKEKPGVQVEGALAL